MGFMPGSTIRCLTVVDDTWNMGCMLFFKRCMPNLCSGLFVPPWVLGNLRSEFLRHNVSIHNMYKPPDCKVIL